VADVRHEEQMAAAVAATVAAFGGIDILVNNASAISLTGTEQTELKRRRTWRTASPNTA
jgi:citronellol/citronellal dehydrogenase